MAQSETVVDQQRDHSNPTCHIQTISIGLVKLRIKNHQVSVHMNVVQEFQIWIVSLQKHLQLWLKTNNHYKKQKPRFCKQTVQKTLHSRRFFREVDILETHVFQNKKLSLCRQVWKKRRRDKIENEVLNLMETMLITYHQV